MARRQSLFEDGRAVSPIISVILMVAVTVVLAATVFVLVDEFSASPPPAPTVIFHISDTQDRLEVIGAQSVADWLRLQARVDSQSGAGAIYMGTDAAGGYQNEPAAATGANILITPSDITAESARIAAGDFVEFCSDTQALQAVILIVDSKSNFKLGPYTFGTIDPC